MTIKSRMRARVERLGVGETIYIAGARVGSADYRNANNHVQRVRLSTGGAKTFRLKEMPKSLSITRLT